jgi:hypothetical protein
MGAAMKSDLEARETTLDDYLRGAKSEAEAHDFEEELFARALANEAPELSFRAGLASTLKEMSARGTLDPWLTEHDLERVLGSGLRVLRYELDLSDPRPPDLASEFDLLVTKIAIDLRGVHRLDAEILSPEGVLLKSMPDIGFDPKDGAVYACCEAELARAASSARTITRVWATRDEGRQLVHEIVT